MAPPGAGGRLPPIARRTRRGGAGRLVAPPRLNCISAPLELYDRPANVSVAGFLGSPAMNFIPGELVRGDTPGLRLEDGSLIEMRPYPEDLAGRTVIFGIRPEDVRIVAEGGREAVVGIVEPTGAETVVTARLGGHDVTLLLKDRVALAPGQAIHLSFTADRTHVFDAGDSTRLPA